jgi:hypothetical protein
MFSRFLTKLDRFVFVVRYRVERPVGACPGRTDVSPDDVLIALLRMRTRCFASQFPLTLSDAAILRNTSLASFSWPST